MIFRAPPVICGYNTGQHMWIPASDQCHQINIDIDTGSTGTTREWQIKVTQYDCFSLESPKLDCLQYHTASSGFSKTKTKRLVDAITSSNGSRDAIASKK